MTAKTRATLKSVFEQGDTPQGSDYADMIDSAVNVTDTTAQSLQSELSVTELVTPKVSAAAITATGNTSAADVWADDVYVSGSFVNDAVFDGSVRVSGVTCAATLYVDTIIENGQVQSLNAFAELYVKATVTSFFSAALEWKPLLATTTAGNGDVQANIVQTTSAAFKVQVCADVTAVYDVTGYISYQPMGNAKVYEFGFSKNGADPSQGMVRHLARTAGDSEVVAFGNYFLLANGDTVEIMARNMSDTTSAATIGGAMKIRSL